MRSRPERTWRRFARSAPWRRNRCAAAVATATRRSGSLAGTGFTGQDGKPSDRSSSAASTMARSRICRCVSIDPASTDRLSVARAASPMEFRAQDAVVIVAGRMQERSGHRRSFDAQRVPGVARQSGRIAGDLRASQRSASSSSTTLVAAMTIGRWTGCAGRSAQHERGGLGCTIGPPHECVSGGARSTSRR